MSRKPDGGSAFPSTDFFEEKPCDVIEGMSLRDYFAAKAMHAELVTARALAGPRDALVEGAREAGHGIEEHIAFNAYKLADAMLAERAK